MSPSVETIRSELAAAATGSGPAGADELRAACVRLLEHQSTTGCLP